MAIPCPVQPNYCTGTAQTREVKAAQGSGVAYVPAVTVCANTQNLNSNVAVPCTVEKTVIPPPLPEIGTSPLNPLPYNVNDFLSGINGFIEGIYYDVIFPSADLYAFSGTSTNGNVYFDILRTITFETVKTLSGPTSYSSFIKGAHYIVRFHSDYTSGVVGGYQFIIANTGGSTTTTSTTTTTTPSPFSTTTTLSPLSTTTTTSSTTTTSTTTTTTTLAPTNTFAFNEFVNVPAGLEVIALSYTIPFGMTLDVYSLTASVSGGPARVQLAFNEVTEQIKLTGFMSSSEPSYSINVLSPFRSTSPSSGSQYTCQIKVKNMTRDDQNVYVNFVGDLY